MNALRSIFVELLGWADDAGPLPLSFAVAGILLGVILIVAGVALLTAAGQVPRGVAALLIGAGLMFGTVASRPS